MTEKEKMLSHQIYNSDDIELMSERTAMRKILYNYNHTCFENRKDHVSMLCSVMKDLPQNAWFEPPVYIDYGYNLSVGDAFYANYNCTFIDSGKIVIGDHVLLGPSVSIYTAEHPLEPELRIRGYETVKDVDIGDNTWIGGGTIILPGVRIGKNVVIGGGSVVKHDIPDGVLAAGNPCRIIREITYNHI